MASEIESYKLALLATEEKLAKDPDNPELIEMIDNIKSFLELADELNQDEEEEEKRKAEEKRISDEDRSKSDEANKLRIQEAAKLAAKLNKKRKKKAKLKEKIQAQIDVAERGQQTWQSFVNKGAKGLKKTSMFASPSSVTGRVGVGTNGIADARSVFVKRKK